MTETVVDEFTVQVVRKEWGDGSPRNPRRPIVLLRVKDGRHLAWADSWRGANGAGALLRFLPRALTDHLPRFRDPSEKESA